MATYGLENALFPIGHQFLEVVAPVTAGTAAGRFLDRRGGDGGYMVISQVDDLQVRRRRCAALGVRVAHEIRHDAYRELQLHPRDVGAAMLSFSHQEAGGAAADPWHPAGPGAANPSSRGAQAMEGAELQGDDPEGLAARWSAVTERPLGRDAAARPVIAFDDAALRFVPARDGRGEGLAGLGLTMRRPGGRAGSGESARPGDARGGHGGDLRSALALLTRRPSQITWLSPDEPACLW